MCLACDPGYYCPSVGSTTGTNTICPVGSFCVAGSFQPSLCDAGYYCPSVGSFTGNNTICPAGSFCVAGSYQPSPCDLGYYCPSVGSTSGTNTICPAGSFCVAGSSQPSKCATGAYQSQTGKSACLACDPGYYCPSLGSTTGTNTICPLGSFCVARSSQPLPCDAGFFCSSMGSTTGTNTICPAGSFCVAGSSQPSNCATGAYQSQTGKSVCLACDFGYYCPSVGSTTGTNTICPLGNFCVVGSSLPSPCDAGYYCPSAGSTSGVGSICPAGSFCAAGSSMPSLCSAGSFSLSKQSSCSPCNPGYYCPATGSTTGSDPVYFCRASSYCPSGSSQPRDCPLGSHSQPGSSLSSHCNMPVSTGAKIGLAIGAVIVAVLLGLLIKRCCFRKQEYVPSQLTDLDTLFQEPALSFKLRSLNRVAVPDLRGLIMDLAFISSCDTGSVWRGRCQGFDVVVTKMHAPTAAMQRLIMENLELLFALPSHPHVLRLRGAYLEDRLVCCVTPFMSNGTLQELIMQGDAAWFSDPEQLKSLMLRLFDGLAHLHAYGIMHRDCTCLL